MPITIVMYHSIGDRADRYTVSAADFERQVELLVRRYTVIRLSEAVRRLCAHERPDRRCVVITFDDAFFDFYERAFPVLARHATPSTVFIPAGHVGGYNDWDASDSGCARKRLMDWEHLLELRDTGLVEFGSHTVDHVRMTRLDPEAARDQAGRSRAMIEGRLDIPIRAFAYPYGQLDDFSEGTRGALIAAGYRAAVTTHWGTRNGPGDIYSLRRISFQSGDSEATLRAKIEGWHDWRALKERLGSVMRGRRARFGLRSRASGPSSTSA